MTFNQHSTYISFPAVTTHANEPQDLRVIEPKFTKFLTDVEETTTVSTQQCTCDPSIRRVNFPRHSPIQTKFCTVTKTTKYSSCQFVGGPNAYNKAKMADGRHLETWTNGHILATVWPLRAKFDTVTHWLSEGYG